MQARNLSMWEDAASTVSTLGKKSGVEPEPATDNGPKTGKGAQSLTPAAPGSFERGYALVVGIASYVQVPRLSPVVVSDAVDFARALWDPLLCGYPADHVKLLCDDQATKEAILKGLRWLAKATSEGDTALFFFSGHGTRIPGGSRGAESFLLAYDAAIQERAGLITSRELIDVMAEARADRFGIFLDSCFAGGLMELKDGADGRLKSGLHESFYVDLLGTGRGRALLASSDPSEQSLILPGMRNSLFTHYLLRALEGGAQREDEATIGITDIFHYVSRGVPAHQNNGRQHPMLKGELHTNFPIALAPRRLSAASVRAQVQRAGQDRRDDERRLKERRAPLPERMRRGLWKAFSNRFYNIKEFDSIAELFERKVDFDRMIDALKVIAKQYEYRDKKTGDRCEPEEVLRDITRRFERQVKTGRSPVDRQAIYVIEGIAGEILREYDVTFHERRLLDRRVGDRREGPHTGDGQVR